VSVAKNCKWTKQNKKNILHNACRLAKAFEIMVISDSKPSLITYHTAYIHEACYTKSLNKLCHCDTCLDCTWWIWCRTWHLAKAFEIMVISDSKRSLITYHTVYIHEACYKKSLNKLCHCDICLDCTWWIWCGTWHLNGNYLTSFSIKFGLKSLNINSIIMDDCCQLKLW
jgi:hypothetical protein